MDDIYSKDKILLILEKAETPFYVGFSIGILINNTVKNKLP